MECVISVKDLGHMKLETPLRIRLKGIATDDSLSAAAGGEAAETGAPEIEVPEIRVPRGGVPEIEVGGSFVAAALWQEYNELVEMGAFSGLRQG